MIDSLPVSDDKTILVLGGDGFCGWPTALHLSQLGYDVVIVDNLSRRAIDIELEAQSLTPICMIGERLDAWEQRANKQIEYVRLDIASDYSTLLTLIKYRRPFALVHFAEQRSAPYSMKSPQNKRLTIANNIAATHNILCALTESKLDAHLVHLGTMGVYGYGMTDPSGSVPEGYLKVKIPQTDGSDIEREVLHPADPGSVYHLTKTMDALMFYYYRKNDQLRITDLHQGIVWGTNTEATSLDERLINRFDYDGDFGTVLNRFLMQAAVGHPLTVHGTGRQKRAFIHIRDTIRCIALAIENPPDKGDRVRILNQVAETHRVIDLAKLVAKMTGAEIRHVDNPRIEAESNELVVQTPGFTNLGLEPIRLSEHLMLEIHEVAKRYRHRVDMRKIPSVSYWRS